MAARDLYFRVTVSAEGVAYDLSKDLTKITVEEDDSMADKLTIIVPDSSKVFGFALREGMDVEVDLGYVDDHSIIFRGLVTRIQAEYPEDAVPTTTLDAYDNSIRMGLKRRSRTWKDVDLRGIVEAIAKDSTYKFQSVKIELPENGNPSFTGNGVRQNEKSDLAFLYQLAKEQRCKVFVEPGDSGDTFIFRAEQVIMKADSAGTLEYQCDEGQTRLLSFNVTSDINARRQRQVTASVNPETGEKVDAQREAESERAPENVALNQALTAFGHRNPSRSAALLKLMQHSDAVYQALVDARGDEIRAITTGFMTAEQLRRQAAPAESTLLEGMSGRGVAEGNKDLRAKRNVQIEEVSGRFSGKWYLSQVRHVVDGSGFRTHFSCSR